MAFKTAADLAKASGLEIKNMIAFKRIGTIASFLNGRILKRRSFGIGQIWILNLITPIVRRFDSLLPIPPLSLMAVMGRADARLPPLQYGQYQELARSGVDPHPAAGSVAHVSPHRHVRTDDQPAG